MIHITRREHFNAAHKLFNPKWSEEQNFEVFGKCANPNWHGHNYILEVVVAGEVDTETGFVVNLTILKEIIRENIIKLERLTLSAILRLQKNIIAAK